MKNIRVFHLKFFQILELKFSIYLNRRVFVMKRQNLRHNKFVQVAYMTLGSLYMILYIYKCVMPKVLKRYEL